MSYSALFTSGLSLASQPRTEYESYTASRPPSLQITIHPGSPSPRPRLRKRRSSLTIATSPISAIKSPTRTVNESLRVALRSPREGTFLEALQSPRPKVVRRKTLSSVTDRPSHPAPTSPLPTLPARYLDLPPAPASAPYDACPSSPITAESPFPVRPTLTPAANAWLRPANPARKSSTLLPPRSRSGSASGRGPLSPSPLAGNAAADGGEHDMSMVVEEKECLGPATAWFDDDEEMKENESEV